MFEKIKKNIYVTLVALSCSLAFTSLGGALSWSSPSLVKLRDPDSRITLTTSEESWVGSFLAIGAVVVAIPYTYLFNTAGRKCLILTIAVFYICGWIALIFATEVIHIYVGRFILGCAVGPTYGVIPVYLAEIVKKDLRGANVALLVISQSIGALVQYGIGPILSFQTHNIVSIIFPVILLVCALFIPESPYYLASASHEMDATRVLMKLRGTTSSLEIQNEFEDIKKCLHESPPMSYRELFRELSFTKTQKVIIIIILSNFSQQFSGVGAVIVYMETIFKQMDSPIPPKDAVMMTEALADITVLITLLIIDRVGRKPLLVTASLVCVTANIIIGLFFLFRQDGIISHTYLWIGMIAVFLLQIGYGMGLGPVPILVMSEIMSFSAKGWISGFYLIAQGIFNASSIKLFQIIGDTIGNYYAYWMFALSILASVGFLMWYMPETKGKSLQEIQHILSSNDSEFDPNMITNNTELSKIKDLKGANSINNEISV